MAWSTNLISDSQVEYWSTGVHLKTTLDANLVLNHSVHITGLTPRTLYHYIITSHDAAGNTATLTLEVTQGAKSSQVIYWIIGILLLILIIILIIWLLTRRRRRKYMPPPSPRPTPLAPKPVAAAPTAPVSPQAVVPPFVFPLVKPVEKKEVPPPTPAVPPTTPAEYTEVNVKLTRGDFTLTPIAVERLFSSSNSLTWQEPRALRITRLPGTPVQLRMSVDKQGPEDVVVTYNGAKILFLSPEATEMLGGIAIDFKTTGNGGEFALSKKNTS